jgi:hypothetical protein
LLLPPQEAFLLPYFELALLMLIMPREQANDATNPSVVSISMAFELALLLLLFELALLLLLFKLALLLLLS